MKKSTSFLYWIPLFGILLMIFVTFGMLGTMIAKNKKISNFLMDLFPVHTWSYSKVALLGVYQGLLCIPLGVILVEKIIL